MKLLYSDSEIVVVDKPSGLLSVPGRGPDKQDCVVARVKERFPGCIAQPAVHRLDMYTSGLLVLARTREAQRNLSIQFEKRIPEKIYIALLDGVIREKGGRLELRFRLDVDNRPYQIYDPVHGKTGITTWRRINTENNRTRVEFKPLTGRTHQLRVHSAHEQGLGTPIVGDALYGNGSEGEQMMLHASSLTICHPGTNKRMTFTSEVPF